MDLEKRDELFWRKVDKKSKAPCWIWTGATNGYWGYGIVKIMYHHVYVHRYSYEYYNGEIPIGLQIDHLCNVRLCVNPDHLEAVTQSENMKRAYDRRSHYHG